MDNKTGQPLAWNSRKYIVDAHAVRSEVVQTAFLCIRLALEHELREKFKFMGQAIFNPHFNVMSLIELSLNPKNIEVRE